MTKMFTKKRRPLVETIMLMIGGVIGLFLGLVGILISIPLMFIIVGFFTIFGAAAIVILGFVMIYHSIYTPIECPKCEASLNPGYKNKLICPKCKTIVKFKNGTKR